MPIPFSQIAPHLQSIIINQMDFLDFANLQLASKSVQGITETLSKRLPLKIGIASVDQFGNISSFRNPVLNEIVLANFVRLEINKLRIQLLTDDVCEVVSDFFLASSSTCNSLLPRYIRNCRPESLNNILEAGQFKSFRTDSSINHDCFSNPVFQQLDDVMASCGAQNEDLNALKASSIYLYGTHINDTGLNQFFKDWLTGNRWITHLSVEGKIDLALNLVKGLPESWNPEEFGKSELSKTIPFEALYGPHLHTFLVHREDSKKLLIFVSGDRVTAMEKDSELAALDELCGQDYELTINGC